MKRFLNAVSDAGTAMRFCGILLTTALIPLHAQTPAKPGGKEKEKTVTATRSNSLCPPKSACALRPRHKKVHHLRLSYGVGLSRYTPALLTETGPAWTINSAIYSTQDVNYNAVAPISEPKRLFATSQMYGIEYAYHGKKLFEGKLTVDYDLYRKRRRYTRNESTSVNFFHPTNFLYRNSAFEGMRLIVYEEERRDLYATWLRPMLTRGLSLGGFVGREWYKETNDISFGSLTAIRSTSATEPSLLSWSEGGAVPMNVKMTGFIYGPALRYRVFRWLGINYKFTPVSRSGTMDYVGVQPVTRERPTGQTLETLIPYGYAEVKDKGWRHELEAFIPIFCRYLFTIGLIKEDLKRSYDIFVGNTAILNGIDFFSRKVPTNIGFGEMAASHKVNNLELYFKIDIGICF